jgi:hypothetical protein
MRTALPMDEKEATPVYGVHMKISDPQRTRPRNVECPRGETAQDMAKPKINFKFLQNEALYVGYALVYFPFQSLTSEAKREWS